MRLEILKKPRKARESRKAVEGRLGTPLLNNKDFKDGRDFKVVKGASYEDVHFLRDRESGVAATGRPRPPG